MSFIRICFFCLLFVSTAHAQSSSPQAIGLIEPFHQVELSMPVAGQVADIRISEGSRIAKRDVILTLDREIERLDMASKRLAYENNSAIEDLTRRIETLSDQLKSAQSLLADGGLSQKQVQDEQIALESSRAELKSLIINKAREEIELALAQENFDRRQLRAPIDGIVTRVDIDVGETLPAQKPVIEIVNTFRVRFRGNFSADDTQQFAKGQQARIKANQLGVEIIRPAEIVYVAPIADPSSGLIEVIAEIENKDLAILPGITAELVLN